MGYLIDTNILIYSLKKDEVVNDNFEYYKHIPKAISIISYGELFYRARKSNFPEKNTAIVHHISELFPIMDVNKTIIETFGEVKSYLEKNGKIIDDFDIIIGSTALSMNYTLITSNESHFKRIPGLKVENWTKPVPKNDM